MKTHPFIWSVRREIWENRFLYIVPLAVAVLVLAAYGVSTMGLAQMITSHSQTDDGKPLVLPPGGPFSIGGGSVIFTGIVTGIIYCLGALYNDRRDRSILFWKSLPVPDLATVLAKASIPLVIIPAIIFAITLIMQSVMLVIGAIYATTHAQPLPASWVQWPFYRMGLIQIYALISLALWHAPIYGWLLMVSAWARRSPFLWAVVPPLALCIAEKIAFRSSILSGMLINRLFGVVTVAFNPSAGTYGFTMQFGDLAPRQFLETPALWTGLLLTAVFLLTATRLRRLRGPL